MSTHTQAHLGAVATAIVPLAVIVLVLWALARWAKAPAWALVVALILGVVLSGTIAGPDIHAVLSQLSGGRLH